MSSIRNQLYNLSTELQKELPDYLYHYTTIEGLVGILSNQSLRASNIAFMNDSKEYEYGISIFLNCIEQKKLCDTISTSQNNILDSLKKQLQHSYAKAIFSISYCASEDQLSQWRGYGNEDGAVCIEFHAKELKNLVIVGKTGSHTLSHYLAPAKVIYKREEQEKIVNEFIDIVLSNEENINETNTLDIFINAIKLAVLFKDYSFHEEKEWRSVFLVAVNEHEILFRTRKGVIVPYIETFINNEHKNKRLPISKVIVGPSSCSNYTVESIKTFCVFNELPIDVTVSSIPYR